MSAPVDMGGYAYSSLAAQKGRVYEVGLAVDRVLARIAVHPLGCWEYTGTIRKDGYGQINVKLAGGGWGQRVAHRVVYMSEVGLILEGLTIDHLCFNRRCVNPTHLEAVTAAENTKRMWDAGRGKVAGIGAGLARGAVRTHCMRGHLLDEANVYRWGDGHRKCATCAREQKRRERAAKKAA